MQGLNSSDKQWSNATEKAYSICEKHGAAFRTNISDNRMWIRPMEDDNNVYEEIRSSLNYYKKKKLVDVKKPSRTCGDSGEVFIQIVRK